MKAVVLESTGKAENLIYKDVPTPQLVDSQSVLIKIKACGVAYRDIIERQGGHPLLKTPIIQGHEFSGEVIAVGSNVRRWQIGDRVINRYTDSCGHCDECIGGDERRCVHLTQMYGLTTDGGYAEYAVLHERGLERLLEGISFEEGACIMSAVAVAYHNVHNRIKARPGEDVLLTGASGGVGLAALQFLKLIGCTVWAVTSSEKKVSTLKEWGADHVIVSHGKDIHKSIRAIKPHGLDCAIDCVGSTTLVSTLKSVKRLGRIAVIGTISPEPVHLNLGTLVVNGLTVMGSDGNTRQAIREAMSMVEAGKIKICIDKTLSLSAAVSAHRMLENREAVGRIVLIP